MFCTSGPLTDIALGPTLDCQATVGGKGMYWHPEQQLGECGTFLALAGRDLWRRQGHQHATPGLSFYLYHAADCHLPDGGLFGVSYGYAFTAPFVIRGVGCAEHPDNRPNGARQALLPTTLGDQGYSYMQGFYQSVWERLNDGLDLSNTVSENVQCDTAMAVAWLCRDCAAELSVRVAVYQPAGRRARTTRRTISVLCSSLRGRCGAAASSAFTAPPPASAAPALVRRGRPPSARAAC